MVNECEQVSRDIDPFKLLSEFRTLPIAGGCINVQGRYYHPVAPVFPALAFLQQ